MANCVVTAEEFLPIVEKLLLHDVDRFTKYDSIVRYFVEELPLTPFNQAMSVHLSAQIYLGLHSLDVETYDVGKAREVLALEDKLDNPDAYIKSIREIYGIKKARTVTSKGVMDAIQKLDELKGITGFHIDKIFQMIREQADPSRYVSQEERDIAINTMVSALVDKIEGYSLPNKTFLKDRIAEFRRTMTGKSGYISLEAVADLLDTEIVLTQSLEIVEATRQGDELFTLDGIRIPKEVVLETRPGRPAPSDKYDNQTRQLFFEGELNAGLVMRDAATQRGSASVALGNIAAVVMNGMVKITAVRTGYVGDQRMDRVRENAANNPELLGLQNRTHETFESQAQIDYLTNAQGSAEVMTVSRPLSQDGFVLIGQVVGTGEVFKLFSLKNYTIVDNNNRTTQVDFSNAEHIEKVKQLAAVASRGKITPLTDEHIAKLQQGYMHYRNMEAQINAAFDSGAPMADVTDIFRNHYQFYQYQNTTKPAVPQYLSDFMSKYPGLVRSVKVVTTDPATEMPLGSTTREVPFILYRRDNQPVNPELSVENFEKLNRSSSWELTNVLNNNEFIEYNGKLLSLEDYFMQSTDLGQLVQWLKSEPKGPQVLMTTGAQGAIFTKNLESIVSQHNNPVFIGYLRDMVNLEQEIKTMPIKDANQRVLAFNTEQYPFFAKKGLAVNMTVMRSPQGLSLGYEIRPLPGSAYDKLGMQKLEIPVDMASMQGYLQSLRNAKPVVAIKGRYKSLQALDLNDDLQLTMFYNEVENLAAKHPEDAELQKFKQDITRNVAGITKGLVDSVSKGVQLMLDNTENTAVVEQFKKDFTFPKSGFQPALMFADMRKVAGATESQFYLQMRPKQVDNASTTNYIVARTGTPSVAVKAVKPTTASSPVVERNPETPAAAPLPVVPAPTYKSATDELPNLDSVFSIQEDFDTADTDDLTTAIAWLGANLPSSIEMRDISALTEAMQVEGTVLGAAKDNVIYLNRQLAKGGTLYHEAFHVVFRGILDTTQRRMLINAVQADPQHADKFTDTALADFAKRRGFAGSRLALRDLMAEEIMADGFKSYMSKRNAPAKGVLGKLFRMLKDLIKFFTQNASVIDRMYENIASGAYRKSSVYSSYQPGQVVYELLQTRRRVVVDGSGKEGVMTAYLPVEDQRQLVNRLAMEMIHSNIATSKEDSEQKLTQRQKFDQIREILSRTDYDVNNLMTAEMDEAAKQRVLAKYKTRYEDMRAVLSWGTNAFDAVKENFSGNTTHDNSTELSNGGLQESVDELFSAVMKTIEHINYGVIEAEKENPVLDAPEQDAEGEDVDTSEEEIGAAAAFDKSFFNVNPMDSIRREMRQYFSLIKYTETDADTGAKIVRMIDGTMVFNMMMKVAANAMPEQIIPRFIEAVENYRYNGNTEAALTMQAVVDTIRERIELDENNRAVGGDMVLYNQLVDTFHFNEMGNAMMDIRTTREIDYFDEEDGKERYRSTNNVSLIDNLVQGDMYAQLDRIVASVRSTNSAIGNTESYKKNAERLAVIIGSEIKRKNRITELLREQREPALEALTSELHSLMQSIGFDIPKSLIRFSLLAIDVQENNVIPIEGSPAFQHYFPVQELAASKNYLEKDFFTDLANFATELSKGVQLASAEGQKTDIFSRDRKDKNRFYAILRKASYFMVKFDPREVPTVVANAEGKKIYRYVRYTPASLMLQEIRERGLESLKNTEYAQEYLNDWYADNFMMKKARITSAVGTNEQVQNRAAARTFFNNIDLALFAGIRQRVDGKYVKATNYGALDEVSMHQQEILAFTQRNTLRESHIFTDENGAPVVVKGEVVTYKRFLTQPEASNTGFLVDAMYENFSDMDADIVAAVLKKIIQQEYNRIGREYSKREERERRLAAGDNTFLNNFNAVRGKNGELITDDKDLPENKKLRAYQFNLLNDFFRQGEDAESFDEGSVQRLRAELRNEMIAAAKSGMTFESYLAANPDKVEDALTTYLNERQQEYVDKLISIGLVQKLNDGSIRINGMPGKINTGGGQSVDFGAAYKSAEAFLFDLNMNTFVNGLLVNQLIDGDRAMGIKNAIDYFKRNKSLLAAGSTAKGGTYKAAIVEDITALMDPNDIEAGQYDSLDEVPAELREQIEKNGSQEKIFDGQAITTLMHRMDFLSAVGRLPQKAQELLIQSHYRRLTEKEYKYLKDNKVTLNSMKTVHGGRLLYFKESEHLINRLDVSDMQLNGLTQEDVMTKLDAAYREVYNLRAKARMLAPNDIELHHLQKQIRDIFEMDIHVHWTAKPHRKQLHDLLHAMEYNQVDMLMDTNASKKATPLPVSMNQRDNGYIDLNAGSVQVDARYKFLQVETSGIKNEAKAGVQSKVLLPADITNLMENLQAEGVSAEKLEKLDAALSDYNSALYEGTKQRFDKMVKELRDDSGNINTGKLYDVIRASLEKQGADSVTLAYFETKNGEPVYDLNLPQIRSVFQYYFMSHYSKKVLDEKVTGGKYIHATGYGNKVIFDTVEQRVVPTFERDANPAEYDNNPRYITRYPGVYKEGDNYVVEVIMPLPYFKNEQQKKLYMEKMTKGFAARIPTEDKRSMLIYKVVDFIDSAYGNTVIVPHLVHLLAGSDLDVDTLYVQSYAAYEDITGTMHVFGDTSQYEELTKDESEFSEFIHGALEDRDYESMIDAERHELMADADIDPELVKSEATDAFMKMLGMPTYSEMEKAAAFYEDARTSIKAVNEELKALRENEEGEIDRAEEKALNRELRTLKKAKFEQGVSQSRFRNYQRTYVRVHSLMRVLAKNDMPITLQQFKLNPKNSLQSWQNKFLDARIELLSNELVYNNLYKNERSNTEAFSRMARGILNLSPEDLARKFNAYSIMGVVNANQQNTGGKKGIGVAANFNKFMALSSSYGLELNNDNQIWFLTDETGKDQKFARFGGKGNLRPIKTVGEMLGMFADSVKDPLPTILQMNDINLQVSLSMVGLGLPLEMSVFINMLPEVMTAVEAVKASETNGRYVMSLSQAINAQLFPKKDKTGLLTKEVTAEMEAANIRSKSGKFDMNGVTMRYEVPANVDSNRMYNKELTPRELGFIIEAKNGAPLSLEAQKVVLLHLYNKQVRQNFQIAKATRVVNLYKRLRPELKTLDNFIDSFEMLRGNELFRNSSQLFEKGSVFTVLEDTVTDAYQQASRMFVSRNPALKPLLALFDGVLRDKETLTDVLIGTMALKKFKSDAAKPASGPQALRNELALEMMKPEFWYGAVSDASKHTTLEQDMEYLREHYANNPFVKFIGTTGKDDAGYARKYTVAQMSSKVRFDNNLKEEVIDGYRLLQRSMDKRAQIVSYKLFLHELIRHGLGSGRSNRFINYISADRFKPVSDNVADLIKILGSAGVVNKLQDFMGGENPVNLFRDLYINMIDTIAATPDAKVTQTRVYVENRPAAEKLFSINLEGVKAEKRMIDITDFVKVKDELIELIVDTNQSFDESLSEVSSMLYSMGIRVDDMEAGTYVFPAVLQSAKGEYFALTAIQRDPSQDLKRLSEGIVENLREGEPLTGVKARYQLWKPRTVKEMSLAAFSQDQVADFIDYANDAKELPSTFVPEIVVDTVPVVTAPASSPTTVNVYAGTGENAELSNFAKRPFSHPDLTNGEVFDTVEGAFHAAKLAYSSYMGADGLLTEEGRRIREQLKTATGSQARSIGRSIPGLDRAKWDNVSAGFLKQYMKLSFEQNPSALEGLLATGTAQLTHKVKGVEQDNGRFSKLLTDVRQELGGAKRVQSSTTVQEVSVAKNFYTRAEVRGNPETAYVFTENTYSMTAFPDRSGGGSAVIRPEANAYAIVTKKKYDYNTRENVDYSDTDANFEEFKAVNTQLIGNLKNSGKTKVVFPQGFATDKATMPTRFAEWLQKALLDNFGLVTELNASKTGLISKGVGIAPQLNATPGRYVTFNDELYIITKINDNDTVQIYNPTKEGVEAKKSVAMRNLSLRPESAIIVEHKDGSYLVTPKNTIISMKTFKAMQWQESNGDRRVVLQKAENVRKEASTIKMPDIGGQQLNQNLQDGDVESNCQ